MCVGDTQVLTGQWVSAAYVAAVVSSGTRHSSILTGILAITVDSAVAVSWAIEVSSFTRRKTTAVHGTVRSRATCNAGIVAGITATTLDSTVAITGGTNDISILTLVVSTITLSSAPDVAGTVLFTCDICIPSNIVTTVPSIKVEDTGTTLFTDKLGPLASFSSIDAIHITKSIC